MSWEDQDERDYHELGIDAADVKRTEPGFTEEHIKMLTPKGTPTREVPQPEGIPTREVGSKYLKPGDKVRHRGTDKQGVVSRLTEDLCEALVQWDGDDNDSGYYDVRDLVKRA